MRRSSGYGSGEGSDEAPRSEMLSQAVWRRIGAALGLSRRELQVALCMLDHLSVLRTAKRLGITENTVHSHRARIYHKLGVYGPAGVVAKLFQAYVDLAERQGEA